MNNNKTDFIILSSEQEFVSDYHYSFIILLWWYIGSIVYFLMNSNSTNIWAIFNSYVFYIMTFIYLFSIFLLYKRKQTIKWQKYIYEILDDYIFLFLQNILIWNKKIKKGFNNDFKVKIVSFYWRC